MAMPAAAANAMNTRGWSFFIGFTFVMTSMNATSIISGRRTAAPTEDALTDKYETMVREMILPSIPDGLAGVIYTQNADVEGEINGLYTADRTVCKVNKERMRTIKAAIFGTPPYSL